MESKRIYMRWPDFERSIGKAFQELREGKELFDVTLACKDGKLEAHKVILSSCSPVLKDILKDIIKDNLISEGAAIGWMADFGEYTPVEVKLDPSWDKASHTFHNHYPYEWTKIN